MEAAVFALLGLLLGFSFAGGTSRLESKRQLIVQANAIGTAYLRLDELPPNDQPEMRRLYRDYLDARLRVYEKLPDLNAAEQEMTRVAELEIRCKGFDKVLRFVRMPAHEPAKPRERSRQ